MLKILFSLAIWGMALGGCNTSTNVVAVSGGQVNDTPTSADDLPPVDMTLDSHRSPAVTPTISPSPSPTPINTYYISPNGNDSNSGTSTDLPWQSFKNVNNRAFSPGTQIAFEAGYIYSGSLYFTTGQGGTATNPVTFTSYPLSGTARATLHTSGTGSFFYAYNVAGFKFQNINFTGPGASTSQKAGVFFYTDLSANVKLPYVHFDHVDVSGFADGIEIGSWNGSSGYKDISLSFVNSFNNLDQGFETYASTNVTNAHTGLYVGNSTFYSNKGRIVSSGNSGSGILIGGVDGAVVENSMAYDNGINGNGGAGIWTYESNNVIFRYNQSYSNHTHTTSDNSSSDGDGFDFDGGVTNSQMYGNTSHDNDGAGYLLCQFPGATAHSGNTVKANISVNDGRKDKYGAIQIYTPYGMTLNNDVIDGNTITMEKGAYSGNTAFVVWDWNGVNLSITNNTLHTTTGIGMIYVGGDIAYRQPTTILNNLFVP